MMPTNSWIPFLIERWSLCRLSLDLGGLMTSLLIEWGRSNAVPDSNLRL